MEEELESEKEEDSEEEMQLTPKQTVASGRSVESEAPALTKAQVRELRRVKKLDHSWFSGLLDS